MSGFENISKHQESQRKTILSNFINLEKGGEGSRGGKIIGHTKSGKPIYESHNHKSQKEFKEGETQSGKKITKNSKESGTDKWSHQDHIDASKHYEKHGDEKQASWHKEAADTFTDREKSNSKQAEKSEKKEESKSSSSKQYFRKDSSGKIVSISKKEADLRKIAKEVNFKELLDKHAPEDIESLPDLDDYVNDWHNSGGIDEELLTPEKLKEDIIKYAKSLD